MATPIETLTSAGLDTLKEAVMLSFPTKGPPWRSTTVVRRAMFGPSDDETRAHRVLVLYLLNQLEDEKRLIRDGNSWRLPESD